MNALVNNVAYALYMGSSMPMLGPGADALRQPGFKRGKAWALTALKNYGSTNRAALVAECLARGLEQLGTVPELKARLGRSDDGQLEAADWLPLAAAGPAANLDTAEHTISGMDFGTLRQFLHEQQLQKGDEWVPVVLPHSLGTAVGPTEYALRLVRQYAAALLNAPVVQPAAEAAAPDGGVSGQKRQRGQSATEMEAEMRVRSTKLRSFLITDPSQTENRLRLMVAGALKPDVVGVIEAILLPGVESELEFTAERVKQAVLDTVGAVGGADPAPVAQQAPDGAVMQAMEARLMAAISAAESGGEIKKKMARLESRTRASAACLASVALPSHQARWKNEITELQTQLNEAEDMESELLAVGSEVPPSLAARIKKLRKRFDLATIATRDGDHGFEVLAQLKEKDQYGEDAIAEYQALEKSLKKYKEKTGRNGGAGQQFGIQQFGNQQLGNQQFGNRAAAGQFQFGSAPGAAQPTFASPASFGGRAAQGQQQHQLGFGNAGAPVFQSGGRGADMVRPAWMENPPGVGRGPRLRGIAGNPIHLEGRVLTTPVESLAVGGTVDNAGLRCRNCGTAGHIMFECPQLRQKFQAGEVNEHGHPIQPSR